MQRPPPRRSGAKEVPLDEYMPPYETPSMRNIPKPQVSYMGRIFEKWFGVRQITRSDELGRGAFGIVKLMKITREMRDHFVRVPFTFKYIDVVTPRTGVWRVPKDRVAIKVIVGETKAVPTGARAPGARETDGIQRSIAGIRREIDVLKALSTSDAVTIGRKIYDVKRVVPKLYAAGYDRHMHAGVIVMQAFPGWETLYALMTRFNIEAQSKLISIESIYAKYAWVRSQLEYALTSLYVAGYVHMDLHAKNIVVNTATKKLKIIDFGSSVKMTPELRAEFRQRVKATGPSRTGLTSFWDEKLKKFANSVIVGRFATYFGNVPNTYHHNVNIINQLARKYPATYGIGANPNYATPSVSVQPRATPTSVVTIQTNRNNASVKGRSLANSVINLAQSSNNSRAEEGEIRAKKRKRSKSNSNSPLVSARSNNGTLIPRRR